MGKGKEKKGNTLVKKSDDPLASIDREELLQECEEALEKLLRERLGDGESFAKYECAVQPMG